MVDKHSQDKIKHLEKELAAMRRLNKELFNLQLQHDSLEFSWSGNLGHWFWDIKEDKVIFNPKKAETLGFKKEELPESVDFQFFTSRLHPEDYDRVTDAMRKHLANEQPVWEVKYRIRTKDGSYKTYYDRGEVTQRTETGEPLFLTGIVFDITESESEKERLLKKNKEWADLLKRDKLTGLFNRANILVKLGQVVSEVNKNKMGTASIILVDIDNLQHLNALFGPLFGDEVIKKAAAVIKAAINGDHFAGAFAGGKFLIVLPDTSKQGARKIAEEIKTDIQSSEFTQPAEVTTSSGVAEYSTSETVSEFFNRADWVLSKAKRNGKNNILTD